MRLWLARRQIAFVGVHRDTVPAAFAARIGIDAHRKAADYTVAKQRLAMLHTLADALLLLAMTLGGGLAAIVSWTETIAIGPLWRDVLMFAVAGVVYGARQSAVLVVAHVPYRGALRLQSHDARRCGSPTSPRASRSPSSWGCRCWCWSCG